MQYLSLPFFLLVRSKCKKEIFLVEMELVSWVYSNKNFRLCEEYKYKSCEVKSELIN